MLSSLNTNNSILFYMYIYQGTYILEYMYIVKILDLKFFIQFI